MDSIFELEINKRLYYHVHAVCKGTKSSQITNSIIKQHDTIILYHDVYNDNRPFNDFRYGAKQIFMRS